MLCDNQQLSFAFYFFTDNISSSELVLTPAMTNITLPMVESVFDVSVAEVWINISLLEGPESRVTLHPQTALIQLDGI